MSRQPVMSALARVRQERRELRKLMKDLGEIAKQRMREAIAESLIEGRVEGDTVVVVDGPIAAKD